VIVIDAPTLKTDRAFAHFLMAHECCHHTLGHTRIASQSSRHLGLQPFYHIRPLLKNIELDADGYAVRMLTFTKEFDAIESARKNMLEFGAAQTGAYYPRPTSSAPTISFTQPRTIEAMNQLMVLVEVGVGRFGPRHPPPHDACFPLHSPQLNADNVTKPLVAFQAQVSLHAPDGKDVSDLGANTSEQG
jgi:hypothetical protein